jgi:hypothetical protein
MEILHTIAEIIRDLLIFVVAMTALLVGLLIAIARLPDTNPLKRLLTALSFRIGATAAAGALAIPVEPILGLDMAYDIGVPLALIVYWLSIFKDVRQFLTRAPKPSSPVHPSLPQPSPPQIARKR